MINPLNLRRFIDGYNKDFTFVMGENEMYGNFTEKGNEG